MPGCPPEDHLARFLSGQLDAAAEESLCDHVETCSRCQSVLESLARKLYAPEEIRTIQGFDPPPNEDFLQRLKEDFLQRLKEASPSGPRRPGALDAPAPTGSATRDTPWNPEQKEALPPPREPLQVPGYEILGELGRGGMGIVYQARHLRLNRIVALKMVRAVPHLRDRDLVRFKAEAEALARMQHPNVVQVYEVGEHDGHPFLALEFVAGGSLDKKLGGKPLPVREAATLVQILARAVQKVHEQGTLHRDLKPANVLLAADGTPKITDFGLAKRLDEDAGVTATGMVLGTPSYVAPEQAQGMKETIGPAIDVYALGAVLYELLTGRPPFLADTALHTVYQVIHQEPVPPRRLEPHVPRDLDTICLKCLQKAPGKRYATAGALAADLGRFLAGERIQARSLSRPERLWRWCRRNPWPASLLLAVLLGSMFGFWYLSRLSQALVRYSALQGAAQQAELFDEVNSFYSAHVVDRATRSGVEVTHQYAAKPGAIPVPATFTIELGRQISDHSQYGTQVRLYSDYPFRSRKDSGPRDDFEREALRRLSDNPDEPYYRFEEFQGRPALRYATARRMQETCVKCHNSHPESIRTDWKVGDVRGILEIVRPLDKDVARAREGLRGSFFLVLGFSFGLLLLFGLILLLGKRRVPSSIQGP